MATTLKTKNSVTAASAPSSLAQGELAVNITDKKLWVGNAATTPVQLLGTGSSAAFGAVTVTSLTDSGLTTGRVTYATTGGLLQDSANMVFDGSTLTTLNLAYTGTLTGGTGVVNLGSGQFYKDASGNVGIGVTPAGTGGCLQLKSGITFPAIQSASSDANTLDDYEEGTFTPTMSGASGGPVVLSTALGQYTKIGNVVNFRLRVTVSNANAASGTISINGLPFTCSSTISCRNRVVSADVSNFTGNTMDSIGGTFIGNSGTSIQMLNSVFSNVVLTNTSSTDIVGTYFV